MNPTVLELRNVTKRYGRIAAVERLSFTLLRGQVMALLGPSGCGKSTALRTIAGFMDADEGEIRIGGRDMRGVRPHERNVGLVFQDYALFPHLTVSQNVAYGLKRRGFPRRDIPDRVAAMLGTVRLQGFGDRRPAALSGGQQQRVALARALATEPELVLLDEPLSALDAKLRQELQLELKEILERGRATAIIVTHDQDEAMGLAEHVAVMSRGTILQSGPPGEIYRSPGSVEVAKFVGRSNWLRGSMGATDADGIAHFDTADGRLAVRRPMAAAAGDGQLCLRPEALRIVEEASGTARNVIPARVVDVTCLGADTHVVAELGSGTRMLLAERGHVRNPPMRGNEITLTFDPPDALFFKEPPPS